MSKRRSRRADARAAKRRAKESPAYKLGGGDSRYAKKQRGEVAPNHTAPIVWVPCCYRAPADCVCFQRPRRAAEEWAA